jgi:hypothetical protein
MVTRGQRIGEPSLPTDRTLDLACLRLVLSPVCTCPFEPLSYLLGPLGVDGSFVSYKDVQGGFEELWTSGAGSAEEPAIFQRHGQGCVGPLRGLEDPNLPLSAPTGKQLAPTSPKLVERLSEKGASDALSIDLAGTRRPK